LSRSYVSPVLYHLVGSTAPDNDEQNLQTLRAILRSMELRTNKVAGQYGGVIHEIDPNRGCIAGEPIAQAIVCLCDIPFECLGLHTMKYGRFGVGVDRATVAEWGGRPVVYVPTTRYVGGGINNYLAKDVMNAWKGLEKFFPDDTEDRSRTLGAPAKTADEALHLAQTTLSHLLAYIKTFDVALPEDSPKNFYMEREWRKQGKLELQLPLREIIAPAQNHEQLQTEFPHLAHLSFREAPDT
jgi:hypothetical protein